MKMLLGRRADCQFVAGLHNNPVVKQPYFHMPEGEPPHSFLREEEVQGIPVVL